MRQKLERGETVYVLGIGPGGHNAGVGLVEASKGRGIRLIANHEEERFRAVKHFQRYPEMSVQILAEQMKQLGIEPERIHAACASWDYPHWTGKAHRERGAGTAGQPAVAHARGVAADECAVRVRRVSARREDWGGASTRTASACR